MASLIEIDGAHGEGGGQIIRTSLSLSAMTGQPVEIRNVRAGRSKPGLQPQHLASVRAAAAICGADLEGDAIGSTRILFSPQTQPRPGHYSFDIGTAGAAPLVAQTVLVPLSHAGENSHVTITGGTHVPHAPAAEYLEAVYLPALQRAGMEVQFEAPSYGFYPRGGGQLEIEIGASAARPVDFTHRGKLLKLTAFVVTSQLPDHVAQRGQAAIEQAMRAIGRPVTVERRERSSNGAGAAVILAAECEGGFAGFTSIGARGKPMEKVAEEPCAQFLAWWKTGAACDQHLSDQLALPLALAGGPSSWSTPKLTDHIRTVLWVVERFLPVRVSLAEQDDGTGLVTVQQIMNRRIAP